MATHTITMRSIASASLAILLVVVFGGCDTDGPCVILYDTPLLQISSVEDSQTGEEISEVAISDVRLSGNGEVSREELLEHKSSNVSLEEGRLICTTPCAFAEQQGEYAFSISTTGYQSKQVSYDAEYDNYDGGCPGRYSGSMEIDLELDPAD